MKMTERKFKALAKLIESRNFICANDVKIFNEDFETIIRYRDGNNMLISIYFTNAYDNECIVSWFDINDKIHWYSTTKTDKISELEFNMRLGVTLKEISKYIEDTYFNSPEYLKAIGA